MIFFTLCNLILANKTILSKEGELASAGNWNMIRQFERGKTFDYFFST